MVDTSPESRGADTSDGSPSLPLPESQAWRALIALCIGFFMILLDQTIVAVATPEFQSELHASYNSVIWVTSIYLLTFAVPLLITGRLGDRFGPRNIYLIGMVIFTVGSLACGLSPSIEVLIAARAFQGIGAALLTPQTMAVINRIFPRERRGAAMGIWGATAGLSTLAGPILGGLITEYVGWSWIFFINVPIGVISIVMVVLWVPRMRRTERKIDTLSMVLSIVAVFCFVYAVQEGQTQHWVWWIWALVVVAVLLGVWFVRQQGVAEAAGRDPLVPLRLFRIRNFTTGNIGIIAMGFTVAGTPLPIMMFFQQVHGLTPLQAGLMMIPQAGLSMVLSPFVGRLTDHRGSRGPGIFGFAMMAVSTVGMFLVMQADVRLWWMVVPLVGLGLGNAFVWAPNSASTMRDLPGELMGAGSGVYNQTRQLGAVIGAASIGAVLQIRIAVTDPGTAFGQSVLLAAVMLVIGLVATALSRDVRGGRARQEAPAGADDAS